MRDADEPVGTFTILVFSGGAMGALTSWRAASLAYDVGAYGFMVAWGTFGLIAGACGVYGAYRIFVPKTKKMAEGFEVIMPNRGSPMNKTFLTPDQKTKPGV